MWTLFAAELRRSWLEFIRYPAEAIVSTAILVVLFYGFFLGASYMAGAAPGFGERLDAIIVGYVVWTLVLHSLTSVANDVQKEAQVGAMQQVFLSSYGATRVFVNRTLADIALTSVITLTTLGAILLLTGRRFDFSWVSLAPVGAVLLGSFGLAFLMGALALWLKRIQQLLHLGQFVLLGLVMVPFETWEGTAANVQFALPIVSGVGMLRDLLVHGKDLSPDILLFAYTGNLLYAVFGVLVFHLAIRRVKTLGTLGWY